MAKYRGVAEYLKQNKTSGRMPWRVDARLYKLVPPYEWTYIDYDSDEDDTYVTLEVEYVVVSAAELPNGPETLIFAADESGEWLRFIEMPGSQKGKHHPPSHHSVLENLGYSTDYLLDEIEALEKNR